MTQATQSDSSRQTNIDKTAVTKQVAAVGVGGNVALSAIKLIAGIMGNSTAMISDAIHSLSDVFATAIAFIGVRLAERDADATHPYGHERFECVASLMLGLILAGTGLAIGYSSIETIATRSYASASAPTIVALAAAVLSIVVKEGMFWYTRHWARVLNSSAKSGVASRRFRAWCASMRCARANSAIACMSMPRSPSMDSSSL